MAASSSSAAFLAAVVVITLLASPSSASSRSIPAAAATTNTEFIRTSCSATTYPKLCYNSLAIHAFKTQNSAKQLASTALDVTLASAKSTSAAMVKLSQTRGLVPREAAAMRDCMEELRDAVDQIRQSIDEMQASKGTDVGMMISDVQTRVSAALTEVGMCNDGFAGKAMAGEMKTVVGGRIQMIAQLTSNALALISSYTALRHLRPSGPSD